MHKQYGLLLKSCAASKDEVVHAIDLVVKHVNHAKWVYFKNGLAVFGRVMVVVPKREDCGVTALLLREKFFNERLDNRVQIVELEEHDSREAFDAGVKLLEEEGFTKIVLAVGEEFESVKGTTIQEIEDVFLSDSEEVRLDIGFSLVREGVALGVPVSATR